MGNEQPGHMDSPKLEKFENVAFFSLPLRPSFFDTFKHEFVSDCQSVDPFISPLINHKYIEILRTGIHKLKYNQKALKT